MRWLSERDLAAEARVRLFCFPHAGSGAAGFYRWKRLLPPSIAVCPVLLPGRESRFAEAPALSTNEIVRALNADLADTRHLPCAIYGHSMGALLAYEWARSLPREGPLAPLALLVSGRNAPATAGSERNLYTLADAGLVDALRARYGTHGAALLDDPELRAMFLPIVRADLQIVETYRHVAGEPLHCPVSGFAGEADTSVSAQGLAAWSQTTTAEFHSSRLPGDHFFHFAEGQAALLAAIQHAIQQATQRAE